MILIIHRDYRLSGGEEVFLDKVLVPALTLRKHDFEVFRLPALFSKGHFFSSLFEILAMGLGCERWRPSYRLVKNKLILAKPRHLILNNFLPTISLKVPALARSNGINVMAWIHNGRLSCANGLFFNGSSTCHRCFTDGSRWALFYRCHETFAQSLLYALTYRFRRVSKEVTQHVNLFVAPSDYTAKNIKDVLCVLDQNVSVVTLRSAPVKEVENQNLYSEPARLKVHLSELKNPFFIFVGRLSHEKGADIFASLAERFGEIHFILCGEGPQLEEIKSKNLKNLFILGFVDDDEKNWLYQEAAAVILPSRVPENAPMVIVESQAAGVPVVYPSGGGAEELVGFLGRSGCALEDFRGQIFERSKKVGLRKIQETFENQLELILNNRTSSPLNQSDL